MGYNVSARPLRITVTGDGKEIILDELPNDADPIEIEPVMYGEPVMDVNGNLITKRRHVPVKVVISAIPGSDSEKALSNLVYDEFVNGKKIPIKITTSLITRNGMTVGSNPNVKPDTYKDGRFMGATVGYAVSRGGMFETKRYHFVFKNGSQC